MILFESDEVFVSVWNYNYIELPKLDPSIPVLVVFLKTCDSL